MGVQPTGTVTFLFTDIEGSTKRWEEHSQQMGQTLTRHDSILRSTIEGHGGYVFKTVGDAFCAGFSTPHSALAAALDAQIALCGEDWGNAGNLKVRMALHTGVTEERAGDYFGQPVNRVARLLSAGHGGQVLLSNSSRDLVLDNLPAEVGLLDMGEHRLKDLIRPERIFQVQAPGLPSDFPPLKTLDSRPNNLPLQPTPLVGREAEVAAVVERLHRPEVRLLTLTGPGGTGKSRLGLQAAAELVDDFSDGVWFVNLAPISDPNIVLSLIVQVIGVREPTSTSPLETLKAYLQDREMLLLLDNFEQVVDAAPLLADLLSAAQGLRVIVTSRLPLQLRAEHEYEVQPLQLPDPRHPVPPDRLIQYEAVRLFVERAQAVKADFRATPENISAVAEICARLDGLPLAIELAAARVRLLPPPAMLPRLKSRLKLLTGGARDLPARQQTLHAAIEWSYTLLSVDEQRLFWRLALFVGGCTLEAIEAVCNAHADLGIDVLEGVESLLSKSLLRQEEGVGGEPRFVMLETIHEYAHETLEESGEGADLRRHHAEYFLVLAEEAKGMWEGLRQVEWLDRLEQDHSNIRAALEWSQTTPGHGPMLGLRLGAAIWRFWEVRGYLNEGRVWLGKVLSHSAAVGLTSRPGGIESIEISQLALRSRAEALIGVARLALFQSDFRGALPYVEESLALLRVLGDNANLALALSNLGFMLMSRGDLAAAQTAYEESLAIRRDMGDKVGVSGTLTNVGLVAACRGDYPLARTLLEESLTLCEEVDNRTGRAYALRHLGFTAHSQGDYSEAGALLRESLTLFRAQGNKRLIAECLMELAALTGVQGRPEAGARLFGAADALYAALGTTVWNTNRPIYERDLAATRAQLDEEEWQKAWGEGHALSIEEAIACALEEPGSG